MTDKSNKDFKEFFLKLLENDEKKIKLDSMQQNALFVDKNAVIAAGAGSGKTQVLATRFAWLVLNGTKIDKILTLTFTKKAASEMYERIYKTLTMFAQNEELCEKFPEKKELAQKALDNFSNGHIQTLDSYCGKIVRQYANKYGLRPDFTTGSADASANIKTKAFKFILQNRKEPGVQKFAKPGKLQDFAENTFGAAIEKYTSLATEDNYFSKKLQVQIKEIVKVWNKLINEEQIEDEITGENVKYKNIKTTINNLLEIIPDEICSNNNELDKIEEKRLSGKKLSKDNLKKVDKYTNNLKYANLVYDFAKRKKEILNTFKQIKEKDIIEKSEEISNQIKETKLIFKEIDEISQKYKKITIDNILDCLSDIKDSSVLYNSIFAFVEHYEALVSLNKLFDTFLKDVNSMKRSTGNLSFNDISEMVIKILIENEDARNQEKNAFEKIMIDEFQDNNGKNRDLLYILSLKKGAFEKDVDGKEIDISENALPIVEQIKNERDSNKLFFVGDEKQSIYRFRGADVSVFNSLTKDNENELVPMTYNYRSTTELIEAFNIFFKNGNGIFGNYNTDNSDEDNQKDYEAYYSNDAKAKNDDHCEITSENVPIHIKLLKDFSRKNELRKIYYSGAEQIAYNMAKQIYDMHDDNKKWSDFAILERSRKDASIITKYLNMFNIPYNIDQFNNIFDEGIINDFYNFLRLCVYPSDIRSYAAYITSPFCGLNENAAEVILSYFVPYSNDFNVSIAEIDLKDISENLKKDLDQLNTNNFSKLSSSISFYKENRNKFLRQKITSTLSYLWNDKGYKYETYISEKAQLISEQFDMFFELGRLTDDSGKNLSWFIDQLAITKDTYSQENADINIKDVEYPFERKDAVNIMTIHKSKGLEFPHVFVYGCTEVPSGSSKEKIFYDEKTGISIKPDTGEKNYFSLIGESRLDEEEAAELKRLIYVAITRAENDVYIYGQWFAPTGKKSKNDNSLRLIENIITNNFYKEDTPPNETEPFIAGNAFDYYVIEPIEYKKLINDSGEKIEKTVDEQREYALGKTASIYDESNVDIIAFESIPPYEHKSPSSLEFTPENSDKKEPDKNVEEDDFNKKIATLVPGKLQNNDFGTIAHAYEEAQVNGVPLEEFQPDYQLIKNLQPGEVETLKEICFEMCRTFKESSLGQALEKTKENVRNNVPGAFYRAEWGFKMVYKASENGDSGKEDIFNGIMDLIFSNGDGSYTIVDYKSDKDIVPETYIGQQHCYRTAASELLGVPEEKISLYLYYLRYDKVVPLD